jgi:hypothetical protein
MKRAILVLLIALFIFFTGCTTTNNPDPLSVETQNEGNAVTQIETENNVVLSPTNTPSPVQVESERTIEPAITSTIDLNCPFSEDYHWSHVFPSETSYIDAILPLDSDTFLLSTTLDDYDGTILIKITSNGDVLWQKKVISFIGDMEAAPDGHFLLVNSSATLDFDADGNIVQTVNTAAYMPQKDGVISLAKGGEVMRFDNPDSPQWAFTLNNPNAYIALTQDGGAISAYAGAYVDQSVYYAPIYTDIKVNKIDANGQVWQRTYGKLIGDETLDYVGPTTDGGAILAGTHTYEELGSDYDIWIMKVNQTGSMSWQSTLKHAPDSDYITGITLLPKGIVILSEDLYTGELRLVKLSNNGSLLWQKEINSIRGPILVNRISETKDGSILVSGETRETTSINFLAKFDVKGNIVWEKQTGFDSIENTATNYITAIYPMENGDILIAGSSNLMGTTVMGKFGGWIARIQDKGTPLNFLNLSPGKFSVITTLSSRPNNLPDEITPLDTVAFSNIDVNTENINLSYLPACLPSEITYPTPQTLPSLTPSLTPTLVFQRDLYLTQPENMQGEDVLTLQQRLIALGYTEVGTPDGIFGKMSDNAVRLFQQNNGLEVDGYVGPITWKTLFSESAIGK